MRTHNALLVAGLMTAVALAGCISENGEELAADLSEQPAADPWTDSALPEFRIELTDCTEAGGVSTYNSNEGDKLGATEFVRANVLHDTGEPNILSYGVPRTSDHLTGHWHMVIQCQDSVLEGEDTGFFTFGWVGVSVEAPEWDPSGIERHQFVADFAMENDKVLEKLQGMGVHATDMLESILTVDYTTGAIFTRLDDEVNGIYETEGTIEPYGENPERMVRYWFLLGDAGHSHDESLEDGPGHGYQPFAIDVWESGGEHWVGRDGAQMFQHRRTDHHGCENVPSQVPGEACGAAGNVGFYANVGFDMTITVGPMPPVTMEESYFH